MDNQQNVLLDVEKLHTGYRLQGEFYDAADGIDFTLKRNEVLAIVGESGCGKSTIASSIVGLYNRKNTRVEGEINYKNLNLVNLDEDLFNQVRGNNIGMIFQDHHLLMDRTVYDNVAIPLIIAGASGDDIRRRVSAALDKVGLLDKAKNFPIQLSGGEQQRVGIARAVVNKPAVLLADEPTGNLDDALSEGILRLFEEFNRVGVTVLMATHDINLISRRSYRMLTLSDGHLHGGVGHE